MSSISVKWCDWAAQPDRRKPSSWINEVCCRCRVPGVYYFVFHATLDDRLCVLMKLDQTLLTSFCDHPSKRRQVSWLHECMSLLWFTTAQPVLISVPALVPGDFGQPGSLRVQRSGSLAGDYRLQSDEGNAERLQHLLWLPVALSLTYFTVSV